MNQCGLSLFSKIATFRAVLFGAGLVLLSACRAGETGRENRSERSPLPYARVKVAISASGSAAEVTEQSIHEPGRKAPPPPSANGGAGESVSAMQPPGVGSTGSSIRYGDARKPAPVARVMNLPEHNPQSISPAEQPQPNASSESDISEAGPTASTISNETDLEKSDEAAPAEAKARVLAVVDGSLITEDDIVRELWMRRGRETLEWMVGKKILENELARLDLTISRDEVDSRLDQHIADLGRSFPHLADPDDLVRAASGMKLDEYRERTVWVELALRKIMKAALPPSEQQLRSYYADRMETFILPERVKVSQIFVAPQPPADSDDPPGPVEWGLAERQAQEAVSRLRMGEDFRLVASAYGSGSAFSRWVERGELLRDLEDAVFSMQPGGFSPPLRSPLGFHIIMVEDRSERKLPAFEEVRDEVQSQFEDKLFVYRAGEFMSQLREKAHRNGDLVVADMPLLFSKPF
ncbi:MAG: peptidyl-prolyl cis-trans isomerase [Planctomycetes bacterium]|nr:peptidyl-prolyl cis-trans isomerase [Planctomycetota bacterium]